MSGDTLCVFVEFGGSPVVEVTANTSLSALPAQYTIHRQLSQHAHMPCMYSMVRNDIPAYTQTHKHTQAAATWPESRTGRHQWSFLGINCMSSCPQITHVHAVDRTLQKCAVVTNITLKI